MPKIKPQFTVEFQQSLGPYEFAYILDDGVRVAQMTMMKNAKPFVDFLRDNGVSIEVDDWEPIKGQRRGTTEETARQAKKLPTKRVEATTGNTLRSKHTKAAPRRSSSGGTR